MQSDPILLHPFSHADLISSFSDFFSEGKKKIIKKYILGMSLTLTSIPVFSQWTSMLIQG